MTRGAPSGKFWSTVMCAPDCACRPLMVSPPLPMTRPTKPGGHSRVSVERRSSGDELSSFFSRRSADPPFSDEISSRDADDDATRSVVVSECSGSDTLAGSGRTLSFDDLVAEDFGVAFAASPTASAVSVVSATSFLFVAAGSAEVALGWVALISRRGRALEALRAAPRARRAPKGTGFFFFVRRENPQTRLTRDAFRIAIRRETPELPHGLMSWQRGRGRGARGWDRSATGWR